MEPNTITTAENSKLDNDIKSPSIIENTAHGAFLLCQIRFK